jgi:toxin YoeB
MSDDIVFAHGGFDDYVYWQTEDKRTIKKINNLIKDIIRNGYTGIGNPEPLKGDLSGYWSREIDEKNRLIYKIRDNKDIELYRCKGHYGDK